MLRDRAACSRASTAAGVVIVWLVLAPVERLNSYDEQRSAARGDPVVTRIHQHLGDGPRPVILAVSAKDFSDAVWRRVGHLVAFRLHRHRDDGSPVTDAAIYLVRDSDLYYEAAKVLRTGITTQEYVWCQLAAVIAHESAHTKPNTELEALAAEAEQLRRCLGAGHLSDGSGWNAAAHLGRVEAKRRNAREH